MFEKSKKIKMVKNVDFFFKKLKLENITRCVGCIDTVGYNDQNGVYLKYRDKAAEVMAAKNDNIHPVRHLVTH